MIGSPNTMTALSDKMLDTLRQHNGWITRKQLAQALGRPGQLTPYDVEILEGFVSAGLVERDDRLVGVVKTVMHYRAK